MKAKWTTRKYTQKKLGQKLRTLVSWTHCAAGIVSRSPQNPTGLCRTPLYFLPMSQQQSTFPSTGCVAVTRLIMDNRPVRRRRTGAVRHLLLAAAFLACSSQLLVVDANSWW